MPEPDTYARQSPYELLLPSPDFADRRFPQVTAEARERGVSVENPAAFTMIGAVQEALAELRPGDSGPEVAHDHGHVLYFAYHMWRAQPEVALVSLPTLRQLLAGRGALAQAGWISALARNAGYLQLPQYIVWAEEDGAEEEAVKANVASDASDSGESCRAGGKPPEPVDGFFWVAHSKVFEMAAVTGVRAGRPGFGFLPLAPQPTESLLEWVNENAREGGGEFTTNIPGGEIDGLVGLRTPAELYKLAALTLARAGTSGEGAEVKAPTEAPGDGPPPTTLPWRIL